MKKYILILPLLLLFISVNASNLKDQIKGKWGVVKVETTDQSLNAMINESGEDISKIEIELTEAGYIKLSGNDTKTKYIVKGDKVVFSDGIAKEIKNPEVKASIKSNVLTVDVPAELVKEIMLITKELYVKAGGDTFIAGLIESAAITYVIEGTVTLKRK